MGEDGGEMVWAGSEEPWNYLDGWSEKYTWGDQPGQTTKDHSKEGGFAVTLWQ